MAEIAAKLGDTAPLPRVQLLGADGNAVDLTGATVVARFAEAPAAGSPCTIDAPETDGIVRLASRDDLPEPATGRRSVTIEVEWEVTYSDATIQTFPTEAYDKLVIWQDLDT